MDNKEINTEDLYLRIHNNRLKIDIQKPGLIYKGARFDWNGFITQVTLDDKHTFCIAESLQQGQGTGGVGMCNEFGIFNAFGYDNIAPGERFIKIGVGAVTKQDNEPYFFATNYDFLPFDSGITHENDNITFISESKNYGGYAYRLKKTIRLQENTLTIEYILKNTGEKTIETQEYCHNFLNINRNMVGEDYILSTEYDLVLKTEIKELTIEKNKILFKNNPETFYSHVIGHTNKTGHMWELLHKPSGVGIREYDDFEVSLFALWGTTHAISPEVFVDINLQAGETKKWTRRYEFFE